ncbi:hypothetical protein MTZ49_08720 [Entomomonas sp. E2T0]|uniref:T6SS effector BTH_I2691 family protein n=1 Tax=Entomomonas sp. E2T0 TaxID=2930213 RepID=UPI0022283272|nr:T6SS effector BTH_I2691 family protein [Entomomonas sp. E2T0]UYZ82699.1 hypothetical protein MTZ49_08720 [Entomomonas sp. E2T0]
MGNTAQTNRNDTVRARHDNTASGSGQCPNQVTEIKIFPVRYAVDENFFLEDLSQLDQPQDWKKIITTASEHGLSKEWLAKHPDLDTLLPTLSSRNYNLRQLRSGWLYVWTSQNKLEEYQIKPAQSVGGKPEFIKVDLEANKDKDERTAAGEASQLITVPNTVVYMAYSSVQWSWRICEKMQSAVNSSKWMRKFNLPNYLPEHTDTLENLAKNVADIFQGQPQTNFKSSLTTSNVEHINETRELVSNIPDISILAASDNKQADIIAALDDPFGIIDDLLLGLSYVVTEKTNYEEQNQRKTRIAEIAISLSGLGVDEFLPDQVKEDQEQKYQYLKDLVSLGYLDAAYNAYLEREQNRVAAEMDPPAPWGGFSGSEKQFNSVARAFQAKWASKGGEPKESATVTSATGETQTILWLNKVIEWDRCSNLRRHLKLEEALDHLVKREQALKAYQYCTDNMIADLVLWLDKLSPDADEIFHDTTVFQHSTELFVNAEKIINLIQENSQGSEWLFEQLKKPNTLFGLSFFNFNEDLYKLFVRVASEASQDLAINQTGDKSGTGGVEMSSQLGYNIFSRVNDTIGALSNEHLKDLPFFRELNDVAKRSYAVMQRMSIGNALGKAYNNMVLECLFKFALMQPNELLPYASVITLAPSNDMSFYKNLRFREEFLVWAEDVRKLNADIKALSQQNVELSSKGRTTKEEHLRDRETIRANQRQRTELQRQLALRNAQKPIPFVATAGTINTSVGTEEFFYRQSGQYEAMERAYARAHSALEAKSMASRFVSRFTNEVKVNFLPLVAVVWNLYNTAEAINQAKSFSNTKDTLTITSNIGYLGQSVMTLWMGPVWDRYYKLARGVIDSTNDILRNQNARKLLSLTVKDLAAQNTGLARIAPKLIARVGILNGLLAVGALAEIGTTWKDVENSSNWFEGAGQVVKLVSLIVSGGVGTFAASNAILFLLFDCAFVVGTWVTPVLFVAGIVYLVATIWTQYFHREGLALWLDKCIWGTKCESQGNDEQTQLTELKALYKILLEPAVHLTYTQQYKGPQYGGRGDILYHNQKITGFWLQFALPVELKGNTITLKTLLMEDRIFFRDDVPLEQGYQTFTDTLERWGSWTDPNKPLGEGLPLNPPATSEYRVEPFDYEAHDDFKRYIYTAWVAYESTTDTILSFKLEFPMNFNQPASLLNAPGIEGQPENIDFSYQQVLQTGTIGTIEGKSQPRHLTIDEGKQDGAGFHINNPQYANQLKTYRLMVGQPITDRK